MMTTDELKLAKAKEAYEYAMEQERVSRIALAAAEDSRRKAKEKYDNAFLENQDAEVSRRLSDYRHATK